MHFQRGIIENLRVSTAYSDAFTLKERRTLPAEIFGMSYNSARDEPLLANYKNKVVLCMRLRKSSRDLLLENAVHEEYLRGCHMIDLHRGKLLAYLYEPNNAVFTETQR